MNKTIVFDMHGIIYSHDENSSIKNSKIKFDSIISQKNPQTETEELTLEFDSIQKALENPQDELNIYPIPGAIEKIFEHIKDQDRIIIISTSLAKTQKLILKTFFKQKNINPNLTNNLKFYNSNNYGSKSETETWHQILQKYSNITELYEDTKEYLEAAEYAVKQLGFKSCKFYNSI
jgi:hypothetical protein